MATTKRASRPSRGGSSRRPAREGGSAKQSAKVQTQVKSRLAMATVPASLKPVIYAAVAAVVLILAIGLWYSRFYAQPERVFWKMVDNNLATAGITRETPQDACVPNAESTNLLQTTFKPQITIHCITHINNGSAKLTIETIGNTDADYARYPHVQIGAATPKTDKYSKIYSLWIKNNGNENGMPSLYGQLLNDPVLFGDLNPSQRQKISNGLHSAYRIDYSQVQKDNQGLRQKYTYTVTVPLKKFAIAEKAYADMLQLPIANRINPASYPDSAKVDVKFTVDVPSRHLSSISFQSTTEKYSGYGITTQVNIPKKTVPLSELQSAFQSIK